METLLVSIIVPVFNVKPFLTEALDSILYQTYKNLEIIIIDDGSNDGSGEICDDYEKKDKRIRIVHQVNKGLSAARNAGLSLMTGDLVAFLDSDDAYRRDYIEIMVNSLIRDNADMVICKYYFQHKGGSLTTTVSDKLSPTIKQGVYNRIAALRALSNEAVDHHVWNKLSAASIWEGIRFPVGHVYEDINTTYKLLNRCDVISVVDAPLYFQRKRAHSITNTPSINNIHDWVLAFSHFESFVAANNPEVFSYDDLRHTQRAWVTGTIRRYSRASFFDDREKQLLCDDLQMIIERLNKENEITSMFTAFPYQILLRHPFLLKCVYPWVRLRNQLKD